MARALVCLRYFLLTGTIILGASGIIVASAAGFFIYQLHEYALLTPNSVCGPSVLLLGTGIFTFLLGWYAWQYLDFKIKGQVVVFAVTLAIIASVQTGAGIWSLVRYNQIDPGISNPEKVFALPGKADKPVWDRMQSRLLCCGLHHLSDYKEIPRSCCNTTSLSNPSSTASICPSMHQRGCLYVVFNRTTSILLHVFLLALCSILLQICLIVSVICYTRALQENFEKRRQQMRLSMQSSSSSPIEKKETDSSSNHLVRQSTYSNRFS
ncbi:tetraspanin-6-like [Prorops nasuta]|uniref:tetraspanin-6-like n=1 Tax=Prorops nasuta TaxID=863751 RepID=UPI0034CD276C